MAGSLKDALRKSGLAPADAPAAPRPKGRTAYREELPDDESLPPRFDAPALTEAKPADDGPPPEPSSGGKR